MYPGIFIIVIYVLMALLSLLFIIILCYVLYKNKVAENRKGWQHKVQVIIGDALFDDIDMTSMEAGRKKLLQNKQFRNYLISEIVQSKKNFAGDAGTALRELYESLQLDKDSFSKLQSVRWHIKAKGIQELSVMQQTKYVKRIFRLTNNKNELIRNEAQCALVDFYGFPGLRFLNVMTHSISQWQQIQLLNKMNGQIPEDMSVLKRWLRSTNESLVIFALKLATHYNCFELQADVLHSLGLSYQVRVYAMEYLKKMPATGAGDFLLSDYHQQSNEYKLLILKTLKDIGDDSHVQHLMGLIEEADGEVASQILDTLLVLNPLGTLHLSPSGQQTQPVPMVILSTEHAA